MSKNETEKKLMADIDELLNLVCEIRNLNSNLIYKWIENETLIQDGQHKSVTRCVLSLLVNSPYMNDMHMDKLTKHLSDLENSVIQKSKNTSAYDRRQALGNTPRDLRIEIVNLFLPNDTGRKAQEYAVQSKFVEAIAIMEGCFKDMLLYGISTSILYRLYANLGVYYLVYARTLTMELEDMKYEENARFFEIREALIDNYILEKGFSCLGIAKTLNSKYTFPDSFLQGYVQQEIDSLIRKKDQKDYKTVIEMQKLMFFPGSQFRNISQWKRVLGKESSFAYLQWILKLKLDFETDEVPVLTVS